MAIPSAPGGIGAPVMICKAVPGPTGPRGGVPGGEHACDLELHRRPAVSSERTAKPSMAVLAKGGRSPGSARRPRGLGRRLIERDLDGVERPARREHGPLDLYQGDQLFGALSTMMLLPGGYRLTATIYLALRN